MSLGSDKEAVVRLTDLALEQIAAAKQMLSVAEKTVLLARQIAEEAVIEEMESAANGQTSQSPNPGPPRPTLPTIPPTATGPASTGPVAKPLATLGSQDVSEEDCPHPAGARTGTFESWVCGWCGFTGKYRDDTPHPGISPQDRPSAASGA